ncbi:MAG: DNA polymerase Y family protein [Curvibacter sp.]|nr:DNA polymerase Y family protein [Curvibacter sp.]
MWWIALLPGTAPEAASATELAWWALRYTPRVACHEEGVLLELQASLRLFGGGPVLLRRLLQELQGLGVSRLGLAPRALAALALARSMPEGARRVRRSSAATLAEVLDGLPLAVLGECLPMPDWLLRLGCRSLGQLRALPRAGLSRRGAKALLGLLDQVYGPAPEVFVWLTLPEAFEAGLECPSPVEQAQGLMFGARRLLRQLGLWLAARGMGVRRLTLGWRHDPRRGCAERGSLELRCAEACGDMSHLERLLAEHLARLSLPAPVQSLSLQAAELEPWGAPNASLLPQDQRAGEPLVPCLERLAARLGPSGVCSGGLLADHRPQHRQFWQQAVGRQAAQALAPLLPPGSHWMPSWLLEVPQALSLVGDSPHYHGPLSLLAGPERIEAGWWDGSDAVPADLTLRDYFIARSPQAGLVWVFRLRTGRAGGAGGQWFLHGVFG